MDRLRIAFFRNSFDHPLLDAFDLGVFTDERVKEKPMLGFFLDRYIYS